MCRAFEKQCEVFKRSLRVFLGCKGPYLIAEISPFLKSLRDREPNELQSFVIQVEHFSQMNRFEPLNMRFEMQLYVRVQGNVASMVNW